MIINLPIAEIPVNPFFVAILGLIQGLMTIIFGIGGNFIIIPIMIIKGIEPIFAISSSMLSLVCSFTSALIKNKKAKNINYEFGCIVLIGSLSGSVLGTVIIYLLSYNYYLSDFIKSSYMIMLLITGLTMFKDSLEQITNKKNIQKNTFLYDMIKKLPCRKQLKTIQEETSIIGIILIGIVVGFITSIMGIGGALVLIPFLIYGFNFDIKKAIGTSSFQALFIQCLIVLLHCFLFKSVDIILSLLLMLGSLLGVSIGKKIEIKIKPDYIKIILSIITILVFCNLFLECFVFNKTTYEIITYE